MQSGSEDVQVYLFAADVIVYESDWTGKLLQLINPPSKIARSIIIIKVSSFSIYK